MRLTFFCLFHALFLFLCFRDQRRDGCWSSIIIQPNVHEVGGVRVRSFACDGIFRNDLHFGFD